MFNKKKDLLQQHIILKELFKDKYSKLSFEEKNEVRQAIFDLEDLIASRYWFDKNTFNPYKYIFSNWDGSMVSEKALEIIDKLTFSNNDLLITKTRCCGVTSLFMTYVMWVCLNEKPLEDETNSIWIVSPNYGMSEECNNKLRIRISNLGNRPTVCNKREIEFNGWRIHFMTTSGACEKMCGKGKPHLVIMDEVGCDMDARFKFTDMLSARYPNVRIVEARTKPKDEINAFIGTICEESRNKTGDICQVNVQWFHDIKKCKGLRFERTLHGVLNTIKISNEDIPTVVGNDDYLYEMFKEGWSLNSDWLIDWYKMQPKDDEKCDAKAVATTTVNVMEDIANAVEEISKEMNLTDKEVVVLIDFFKNCNDLDDIENTKKKLLVLSKAMKTGEKGNDNKKAYAKFLKDVFEL